MKDPDAPATLRQKKLLAVLGRREFVNQTVAITKGDASTLIDQIQKEGVVQTSLVESVPEPTSEMKDTSELDTIILEIIESSSDPLSVDDICERAKPKHFLHKKVVNDTITGHALNQSSPYHMIYKNHVMSDKLIRGHRGKAARWYETWRPSKRVMVVKKPITFTPGGSRLDNLIPLLVTKFEKPLRRTEIAELFQNLLVASGQEVASVEKSFNTKLTQIENDMQDMKSLILRISSS